MPTNAQIMSFLRQYSIISVVLVAVIVVLFRFGTQMLEDSTVLHCSLDSLQVGQQVMIDGKQFYITGIDNYGDKLWIKGAN